MNLNKAIGGYFELELNDFGTIYHDHLMALNSGRNEFEYILIQNGYQKIYIPYYTCDVILQPIVRQKIAYEFYYLDDEFYPKDLVLKSQEALLYVNYYGIMNEQVKRLSEMYSNVIIDNSQAFYERPLKDVNTFYSPRKFFGLPDGGFASCASNCAIDFERDNSIERMNHLLTRIEIDAEIGYPIFKANEEKLDRLQIRRMSNLTERIMRSISFEKIKDLRRENFSKFHHRLYERNILTSFIESNNYESPMVYPFLEDGNDELRKKLMDNRIYTPVYWPNVIDWLNDKSQFESFLQNNLIALPIDQRYGDREVSQILDLMAHG